MTFEELDRLIDARAAAHPRPIVSFGELAHLVDVPSGSWWHVIQQMPEEHKPAMFRAFGTSIMQKPAAIEWCKAFVRRNPKRYGIKPEATE